MEIHGIAEEKLKDPVQLRAQAREHFIKARTQVESSFNNFIATIRTAPDNLIGDKIPFDYKNVTLQELVPEWYKDIPDKDIASQQVAQANEKIAIINDVFKAINAEGVKLLQEYNALYQKG